ncbi:FlgO family outer membrane protein [Ectothiorhodospira sp. BSL-9]|uniref:FlgO family outer membrane protein n=1 Tax=Ectothiorhodospira sp. BSL-9 TaxID=1442136 RepID=UPI00143A5C16|nr:FlgO family outer membrane protein [Ectothiorhodospira sp. BSL-9]
MKDDPDTNVGPCYRLPSIKLLASVALSVGLVTPIQVSSGVADGIDQLAAQIVARSVAADRTTIAIASFPHVDDTCSELSNFLVDELVLSFFSMPDNQLSIIERSQLDRIFSELELSLSGAVDVNTTQELGRVHGVDTLLVGTLSTIGDDLRVNARLIDTETAQVYSAAAVNIPRTSTFEQLMEQPAASGCTMRPSGGRGNSRVQAKAQGRPAPSFEISLPDIDEDFEIASLAGSWSGQLNCEKGTWDRAVRLSNPSRIGAEAWYFHHPRTSSSRHAEVITTLSYDMSAGSIGNSFILNVGQRGIPLQLISKGVLYGGFVQDETGEECSLYLGKYD